MNLTRSLKFSRCNLAPKIWSHSKLLSQKARKNTWIPLIELLFIEHTCMWFMNQPKAAKYCYQKTLSKPIPVIGLRPPALNLLLIQFVQSNPFHPFNLLNWICQIKLSPSEIENSELNKIQPQSHFVEVVNSCNFKSLNKLKGKHWLGKAWELLVSTSRCENLPPFIFKNKVCFQIRLYCYELRPVIYSMSGIYPVYKPIGKLELISYEDGYVHHNHRLLIIDYVSSWRVNWYRW